MCVMKQAFGPMMNLPIEMSDTTLNDRLLLKTARGCEFLRGAIDIETILSKGKVRNKPFPFLWVGGGQKGNVVRGSK